MLKVNADQMLTRHYHGACLVIGLLYYVNKVIITLSKKKSMVLPMCLFPNKHGICPKKKLHYLLFISVAYLNEIRFALKRPTLNISTDNSKSP